MESSTSAQRPPAAVPAAPEAAAAHAARARSSHSATATGGSGPADAEDAAVFSEGSDFAARLRKVFGRLGWSRRAGQTASAVDGSEEPLSGSEARRLPAVLISLVCHTALLLLLALFSLSRPAVGPPSFAFEARQVAPRSEQQPTAMLLASGSTPPPPAVVEAASVLPAGSRPADRNTALSELLKISDPQPAPQTAGSLTQLLQASADSLTASFVDTGIEGRQPEKRRQTALARGGTLESEAAVERALDWLAAHQRPSGAWSLLHDQGECRGRCANNGTPERFDPAATGLSLLAFLGAGYTHREGKHRETVRKGIYFLLQIMEETPQGGSFLYQSERGMYNHGIAALAVCEAYQLTQDKDLRRAAQQAIDFIVAAQNYQGGWGYLPKKPGDLTLSGWQVMALKSGFAAGLSIPDSTILNTDLFLDTQQGESGIYFGYRQPGKSATCTSIGQLMRLFRGRLHTDPRTLAAADFLHQVRDKFPDDAYFNYYATLFLFHVGQPYWEEWNASMRDTLVSRQARTGHEAGSWYFDNPYGKEGGRLYTTAMCAMTLEVYYRYSPIYQQADVVFEL
ncbi:MAG: terpene cyclase/mutase family protein [Planctomycetales bacterium]|nr:terpene cyclase/mutase family protein [Planctomycetales bacterium]